VARLQHPNIVQVYEVGDSDGRPFLALEYIGGDCLSRKIVGTALPEREAAQLVETLAHAVHYMHERGILHRDLKPNNILLTTYGTPKIADFGLAKLLDVESGPTRSETLLGTPNYMAPEQAMGETKKVGPCADVYSLGAILYELLTGRAPFQGSTPLNTLVQVRTQEPVSPRRLRRSISPDLDTICLKCLEKDRSHRYSSAQALADDLRCFREGQPIQARPDLIWRRLGRSARRHPALVAWSLVALTAVCLLLTALAYFREADRLAAHQAEEKYQQFVQRRNEALVYGLLAPDEGSLFLGTEATANLRRAGSAAREALALAGMDVDHETAILSPSFPVTRKAEAVDDCYTLVLVLASIHEQQFPHAEGAAEQYRGGLRILDRARELRPQTRAYYLRRAHLLERLGEREEARRETERAAASPPGNSLDHFLIGEEHYRRGDWDQAMNSFNRALTLQPAHFWARFLLAVCHLKVKNWDAARAGLDACLAQQPDFVWAYLFRSFANEQSQALVEAEADFQKALQLNPNEDARYVLSLTRGIHHFNQRNWEKAEADFRSATVLKPEQYNAYLNLAQVCLARGRFEEAAKQAETAMRLRPPTQVIAGYHLERGRSLLREKKDGEAIQECEAALALSPHQPQAHEVRGRALLALGRHEEAESAFEMYLRTGGVTKPDIFRGRGLARMKLGKYPEAVEDYTWALEQAPDADIYQHRGWAHFFSDAWKLALRDFSNAIALDPTSSDAYTGRGLAHVMLGHYREAVAEAEVALNRKPDTPEMMHNIACIFAQAVSRAEADRQEEDRKALAASYHRRALEAIHQTLMMLPPEQRLPFWRDKMLPDAALAPLHDDVEFKRLWEEYGQSR
jgi:serine/threonine-protein kinase